MSQADRIGWVLQKFPEGDYLVGLTPPYEGLPQVLVLTGIGQVWPATDESLQSAQESDPESPLVTFNPRMSLEDILHDMGYGFSTTEPAQSV